MAVEVSAWFGETQLACVRVRDDATFTIGTAPGVDLPVLGFTRFPIVGEGGAIRLPAGVPARHGEHRVELTLGAVTIVLVPATPAVVLARPTAHARRALPYAAGALAMHVALLVAAVALADQPPPVLHVARVAGHPTHVSPPPATPLPPPPAPHRTQARIPPHAPVVAEPGPAPRATAHAAGRARATDLEPGLAGALHALWGPDVPAALEHLDPLYREGDDAAHQFAGTGQRFDPTGRADFASIPAGPYQTPGPAPAVEVQICAGPGCRTTGAIDRDAVSSWIAPRTGDLGACFARDADAGTVIVAFTIDGRGAVHGARAAGASGGCVAAVVASIAFPATDKPTRVTYPIAFRRAS